MAGPDDDRRLPAVPLRPVEQREVIKLLRTRTRTRRSLSAAEALALLRARVQELEHENARLRRGAHGGPA